MRIVKGLAAPLLIILLGGAIASSTATAAYFKVEDKGINEEESAATEGTATSLAVTTKILGIEVTLECTEGSSTGELEEEGRSTSTTKLKHCKVFEGKKALECTVTEPLEAKTTDELTATGESELKGSGAETTIAEAEVKGCAFASKYKLRGTASCTIAEATEEHTSHKVTCTASRESGKVKVGGESASLTYSESQALKGAKKYADAEYEKPQWEINEKTLETGETKIAVESTETASLQFETIAVLTSHEVTGEAKLTGGDPGTGTMKITFHKMEVEGHPACKVKSEGASESGIVVFEMPIELTSLPSERREQPSQYGGVLSIGNKETKIEGTTYTELITVFDFSGTCPSETTAQMPLTGSMGGDLSHPVAGDMFGPFPTNRQIRNPIVDYGDRRGLQLWRYSFSSGRWLSFGLGGTVRQSSGGHHRFDLHLPHMNLDWGVFGGLRFEY